MSGFFVEVVHAEVTMWYARFLRKLLRDGREHGEEGIPARLAGFCVSKSNERITSVLHAEGGHLEDIFAKWLRFGSEVEPIQCIARLPTKLLIKL